jgi:hypothetical protein
MIFMNDTNGILGTLRALPALNLIHGKISSSDHPKKRP